MTRNPNLPMLSVSEPIKVALLTDDPLMRAGLSSLLGELGSIEVVDSDTAEVALALIDLAQRRSQDLTIVYPAPAGLVGVLLAAELLLGQFIAGNRSSSVGAVAHGR